MPVSTKLELAEKLQRLAECRKPPTLTTSDSEETLTQATQKGAEAAYDKHCKMVKGPRMDKDEFCAAAIRLTVARAGNGASMVEE